MPLNDQQFCKSIFDLQERRARLRISHLENDTDTATGFVFQQSIETLHRLIALNEVVKRSTIPDNENKIKEFFKQLGISEQPNKEEIEKEARRLYDKLKELSEIVDTLPAVVKFTPSHSPGLFYGDINGRNNISNFRINRRLLFRLGFRFRLRFRRARSRHGRRRRSSGSRISHTSKHRYGSNIICKSYT